MSLRDNRVTIFIWEGAMKKEESAADRLATTKATFERPTLKRLGTLGELTRHMAGGNMDGGFAGMTMP